MEPVESPPFKSSLADSTDEQSRKEYVQKLLEACIRAEDLSMNTFMIHRMKRLYNPVRALSHEDKNKVMVRAIIMSELDNGMSHQMYFADPMFFKRYQMLSKDLHSYQVNNPLFLGDVVVEERDEGEPLCEEDKVNLAEYAQKVLKLRVMFYCGQIQLGSQGVDLQFLRDYRGKVIRKEDDLFSYALVKAWIFLIDYYLYDKNAIMFCGKDRNIGHLVEIALLFNYVLRRTFTIVGQITKDFDQMKGLPSFPAPSYPTKCVLNNMTPLEKRLDQICGRRETLESYHELYFPDHYPMNERDYWRDDSDGSSDYEELTGNSITAEDRKEPVCRETAELIEHKDLPIVYCSDEEFEQAIESAYNITHISAAIRAFGRIAEYYDPQYADSWSIDDFIIRTITGALFVFTIEGLERFVKS